MDGKHRGNMTVFQLYRGGQCTYPCFPGVLLTSTHHNILSKQLAAFPHNHCRNNGQRTRCFQNLSFPEVYKVGIVWERVKQLTIKQIANGQITFYEVQLTETNDSAAESAEQDQTARMCRLILLYTLREVISSPQTAG